MKERVFIYGLFRGKRCIYVGRTRYPGCRERTHFLHFTKLGFEPRFRILRSVSGLRGAKAERSMILRYRRIGQAEFNLYPKTKAKKVKSISARIGKILALAVALYCRDKNSNRKDVLVSALGQFLADEGYLQPKTS